MDWILVNINEIEYGLLYRDIQYLKTLSNEILSFMKTNVKGTALTFYKRFRENVPHHLNKSEFDAQKFFIW